MRIANPGLVHREGVPVYREVAGKWRLHGKLCQFSNGFHWTRWVPLERSLNEGSKFARNDEQMVSHLAGCVSVEDHRRWANILVPRREKGREKEGGRRRKLHWCVV